LLRSWLPKVRPVGRTTPLEPVLPATAAAFAAGATSMRHVGVIATLMNSRSAFRISLADRVSIEASLGEAAMIFCPRDVRIMGENLLAAADQDGPEPDDRPGRDELNFGTNPDGSGWIRGQFEDAEAFATISTALDARTRPSPENRGTTAGERNAAALAEICRFTLGYDNNSEVGGERPHLVVTIKLQDLENRARGALLHTGGTLTPRSCDAWPATRISSRSCSVNRVNHSTSAGLIAGSHYGPGGPSRPATAAARTPAVIDHRRGARSTM
jgi:uncharacterized protein DUF222